MPNIDKVFQFNPFETTHQERYNAVINLLGKDKISKFIQRTPEELADAYTKDEYFNNINIKEWHRWAGIIQQGNSYKMSGPLCDLFYTHGITTYSPSDLICTLKECARQIAEEVIKEKQTEKEEQDFTME